MIKLLFTLQITLILKLKGEVMLLNSGVLVDILAPHCTLQIGFKNVTR